MKCVNCEMEWSGNEKITASITKCPFCGEDPHGKKEEPKHHENTKDALAAIYRQFGADVLLGRLNGYLPDFAPSVSLADKELVYNVNKMGSSKALKEADKSSQEEKERAVKIAVRNLIDAYVASEVAEKIIYEFTEALGWDIQRSSPRADKKPESQPSAEPLPKIKPAAASKNIKPSKVTRNNITKPVMNAPQKYETLSKDMIGNANRGKYITSEGNWIYYNKRDNDGIHKMRINGIEKCQINSDHSHDLCVLGEWIYYKNISDGRKLYKIRKDGSNK